MKDLEMAVRILKENEYTCVAVKDQEIIYTSKERGVKPILQAIENDRLCLKGTVLADKVIGKAAAFLAVCGGIREIYTDVISENGKAVLEKYQISVQYNKLVSVIINRKGTDLCPMEKLTSNIESPEEALEAIKGFINAQK